MIDSGYKIKSSRLSDRLDALPPEEQEKAFAILDAFDHSVTCSVSPIKK